MKEKGKPGRPPLPLPEPINRPMDEIASIVLKAPAKQPNEWQYLKHRKPRKHA